MSMDDATMRAALAGYLARHAEITAKVQEIKARLAKKTPAASDGTPAARKHVLSAEARKRIAAGQRKRWEDYRKAKAEKQA